MRIIKGERGIAEVEKVQRERESNTTSRNEKQQINFLINKNHLMQSFATLNIQEFKFVVKTLYGI
jgi:hypothetical protein